jgi:4-amino-4-deoxy-L-arabinose transferase-like glycosyltransferase
VFLVFNVRRTKLSFNITASHSNDNQWTGNRALAEKLIYTKNQNRILSASVILLFLCAVVQGLVGVSMTPDGLIYASISMHQAAGVGTFWFPYSMFNEVAFHHHPPLMFGLQSVFFKLLGDWHFVENLYQVVVLLLLCRTLVSLNGTQTGWFTLLLFLMMPVVAYCFTDNFLEPTVSLFTCVAVLCLLKSVMNPLPVDLSRAVGLIVAAALATAAAFLTKGPVGLFPLAALPLTALLYPELRAKSIKMFSGYLGVVCLIVLCLFMVPAARESLAAYFDFQLRGTVAGERPMLHGRGFLIEQWAKSIGVPALLVGVIVAVAAIRKTRLDVDRSTWLWLAIALSASVPLLLSPRQFSWYIFPSLPFYALFFSGIAQQTVSRLRVPKMLLVTAPILLLMYFGTQAYGSFGTWDNDFEERHDLALLTNIVEEGATIGSCSSTDDIYRLFLYLSRHHRVAITGLNEQKWVLCAEAPTSDYRRVEVDLKVSSLYERLPVTNEGR